MLKTGLVLILMASSLTVAAEPQGDADAGRVKAASCAACHGADGIAVIPDYPNLAAQQQRYLQLSIRAYRDGERKHDVMSPMAAGLTEQDIADLAAFYSSLPVQATAAQSTPAK
ncbi:c-type cytochrome [Arsukibacterium sp.]|uniref:c-type cytochrome n=1 Tax=Arsukibacterium sp. TaxID=1977258 RepID=UPI002FDA1C8E